MYEQVQIAKGYSTDLCTCMIEALTQDIEYNVIICKTKNEYFSIYYNAYASKAFDKVDAGQCDIFT